MADARLKVLVLSTVFPNPAQPVHGLFVFERVRHAARHADIRVVAPIAWVLRWHRADVPVHGRRDGIEVVYPTYFYVPGLLKWLDGLFLFLSTVRPVRRLRRTFDFDLIDAHFAFPEGCAAVLLGWWFSRPVVITLRGAEMTLLGFRLRTYMMRWTLARARQVVAVSEQLAQVAVALGAFPAHVHTIGNGVDSGRFVPADAKSARRQLNLPESGRLLVAVGRVVPGKGFHRIVQALVSVRERFGEVRLAIVGGAAPDSGRYPDRLRRLAAELGLESVVIFTGARPPEEVCVWLNAADVLVLASDREGSPNVVWEALACGRPVVATKVGAVEQVVPPYAGVLVDSSEDSWGLSRGISAALERRWDRTAIRSHAEIHTWEKVAERVVACWRLSVRADGDAPSATGSAAPGRATTM